MVLESQGPIRSLAFLIFNCMVGKEATELSFFLQYQHVFSTISRLHLKYGEVYHHHHTTKAPKNQGPQYRSK